MVFTDAGAACRMGLKLYEQSDLEGAEAILGQALLEFPDHGELLQLQGLVWHARRRYAAACNALELAGLLVPLKLAAQLVLADCYRHGQHKDTAQVILSYLATRRDMPTSLLPNLSSGLGKVGEYQLALEVCREAARRSPDCDESIYGIAYYMNKLGYPGECILPLLHRARSLAPDCQLYQISLAVIYVRLGQTLDAYEQFCDLQIENVRCLGCLELMVRTFDRMGDHERRDACCCQLLQITRNAETPACDCGATVRQPSQHNE